MSLRAITARFLSDTIVRPVSKNEARVSPASKPICKASKESIAANSLSHEVSRLSPEEKLKKDKRTLFVGNVSMSVTKRQFENPFRQFGKIVSSRFRSVPVSDKYKKANKKYGVIKKDFKEGTDETKLSQNGYIVFSDESCVKKAVETTGLSGSDIFKTGHLLRLDFVARPESASSKSQAGAVKQFDRKKSVYIPHVPSTVTELEIQSAVESADESFKGTVRGVRIVRSEKSGSFAFVLFSERAFATAAIKLCPNEGIEHTFNGRSVRLRFLRILKEDELKKERIKAKIEVQALAEKASKKSLSRIKWQSRLDKKGIPKVVSHHAMPRAERQALMGGAARRVFNKSLKKSSKK